ncbi:hypothetical protein [Scytonema sp. NUACC26]|uniref:hypothetical protein n=1 Tax=Scytonema sp. NUACC26 TaxID=3140176 RepID=UPI0038B24BA6
MKFLIDTKAIAVRERYLDSLFSDIVLYCRVDKSMQILPIHESIDLLSNRSLLHLYKYKILDCAIAKTMRSMKSFRTCHGFMNFGAIVKHYIAK